MIEMDDGSGGVRERCAERAAKAATIAAFVLTAVILLLGVAASEGWLRDATDWVRRGSNGVLVDVAGVVVSLLVGVVTLFFTFRLIRMTQNSVQVSAQAVQIAADASTQAEKQHKRELLPVVVLVSYSEKRRSTAPAEDYIGTFDPTWERGVRIANVGPGVALEVGRFWSGVWMENDPWIDVAEDGPPTYLASGDHFDIPITPKPDLLRRWSNTPNEFLGAIVIESTDLGIGTITVEYTDIYGQRGRTQCRLAMKTREKRGEIVLKDVQRRLPGSDG